MDKSTLRNELKRKRKENFAFSSSLSNIIISKVISHPKYIQSKKVGIYVSKEDEVNTLPLLTSALKEKQVFVPKVVGDSMIMVRIHSIDELHLGSFNILEPEDNIDASSLDLMIVPMLGYDDQKHRIGYGKGYYDRYFITHPNMYKLGLSYASQHVDTTYPNKNDIPLDEILTELS